MEQRIFGQAQPAHPTVVLNGETWKTCNRCNILKRTTEFSSKSKYNPQPFSRCKQCVLERAAEIRKVKRT